MFQCRCVLSLMHFITVLCTSLQPNEVRCKNNLFLSRLFHAGVISVIILCLTLSCTLYITSSDEAAEWNWDWFYASPIVYLSIPFQWLNHDWRDTDLQANVMVDQTAASKQEHPQLNHTEPRTAVLVMGKLPFMLMD